MKNIQNLKCGNCGSSKYKQISEDLFECSYCQANIVNVNSLKDYFVSDIDKTSGLQNNIRFIKANFSEDEFYKQALIHLSMNKFSPEDILEKSRFEYVDYKYIFYLIIDVEFEGKFVNNNSTNNNTDDSFYISNNEKTLYNEYKVVAIPLMDNCPIQKDKLILNDLDMLLNSQNTSPLSKIDKDKLNIKTPSKEYIEKTLSDIKNQYKNEILRKKQNLNNVECHIKKLKVLGIPEYNLEFVYNNQNYNVSSFAYSLNIMGNIPSISKEVKKQENLRKYMVTMSLSMVAVLSILFGIYNMYFNRSNNLAIINLICVALTFISMSFYNHLSNFIINKFYLKCFNRKKLKLQEFAKNKGLIFENNEIMTMNNFKRWY